MTNPVSWNLKAETWSLTAWRGLLVLFILTGAATPAPAQQMPAAAQMSGVPLGAPDLPNGTVTVRLVREQMGNNLPNQPVTLKSAETSKTATTDAQGRAQFTEFAPGTRVHAEATVDGEALRSQEFDVPAQGGVRVALVAGIAAVAARERAAAEAGAKEPPRPGVVTFGGESRIILEFQDDNLQVFYLLDIVNAARTPIDVGAPLVVELPRAAVGATLMEGSSRLASVGGTRVTITGPFPPGNTSVQLGYTLPYEGPAVTLSQTLPAALEQVFVAVEKVGDLQIASPQTPMQQEADASGQKFIMARGDRLNAGQALTLSLSGLPHRSRAFRTAGMGLALAILAIGLWAAFTGAPERRGRAKELLARREKLFGDLVELESELQQGRVDEKRYAARRRKLVGELERVLGEVDRAPSGGGEGLAA